MPTGWKQCKAPKGKRPKENITKTANKIVNILGQNYTVRFENTRTENVLKNADGECRWYKKEIIIDDELEPKEHKDFVIRHEILHAFLAESGSRRYREDEDIINWFAWNFNKIQKVFNEVIEEVK